MTVELLEREDSVVLDDTDDDDNDVECIACHCSPNFGLCGRYYEVPIDVSISYEQVPNNCEDCLPLAELDCPRCGD
jgi:hypothetical protein